MYEKTLIDIKFPIACITGHSSGSAKTTEEALKLIRRSLKSNSMNRMEGTCFDATYPHIFVIFGASVIYYNTIKSRSFVEIKKNIFFLFVGRFSSEEDLSSIVVVVPGQFAAGRHDFLRICSNKIEHTGIACQMPSVHASA